MFLVVCRVLFLVENKDFIFNGVNTSVCFFLRLGGVLELGRILEWSLDYT